MRSRNRIAGMIILSFLLLSCGESRNGPHKPELVEKSQGGDSGGSEVDFEQVRPILEQRCNSCHITKGGSAPVFNNESTAQEKASRIYTRVSKGEMPADGPQKKAFTEKEKTLLLKWANCVGNNIGCESDSGGDNNKPIPPPKKLYGAELAVQECARCHGEVGKANTNNQYPHLTGQKYTYIFNQLLEFQKGVSSKRANSPEMVTITQNLDEEQMRTVALYYSYFDRDKVLHPNPNKSPRKEKIEGEEKSQAQSVYDGYMKFTSEGCISCHVLAASAPTYPFIHWQKPEYIFNSLIAFQKGERKSIEMEGFANKLSEQDVYDISQYLEFFKWENSAPKAPENPNPPPPPPTPPEEEQPPTPPQPPSEPTPTPPSESPAPTYSQVADILEQRCNSCHKLMAGAVPVFDSETAATEKADRIFARVSTGQMPMIGSDQRKAFDESETEKELLLKWAQCASEKNCN